MKTFWIFSNYSVKKCLISVKIPFWKIKQKNSKIHLPQNFSPFSSFVTMSFLKLSKILRTLKWHWSDNAWRHSRPFYLGFLWVTFSRLISSRKSFEIWSNHQARGSKQLSFSLKFHKLALRKKKRPSRTCTKKKYACSIACSLNKSRVSLRIETLEKSISSLSAQKTKPTSKISANK